MDYTTTKGKCLTCKDQKPLDEMIMFEKPGFYHCTDCEVNKVSSEYDPFDTGHFNKYPTKQNVFKKLLNYLMGAT